MLVITTTMRMVHGVHSNTTSAGPVVTLGLVFVECTTGLEERLVHTSTTSDNADGRARAAADRLFRARGELDARLVLVGAVSDDRRVVAGRAGERAAVARALLDVADDGPFRKLSNGEDVPDGEVSLPATVDECASVEALGRDEGLLAELVAVGIAEDDAGERRTAACVVDDLLDYAAYVAIALGEVEVTEAGGGLVVVRVRLEDCVRAPLCADDPTHRSEEKWKEIRKF